jgi:hypothetical protein
MSVPEGDRALTLRSRLVEQCRSQVAPDAFVTAFTRIGNNLRRWSVVAGRPFRHI